MNPQCLKTIEALDRLARPADAAGDAVLAAHLSECPACSRDLEMRLSMRNRLKTAVSATVAPPELKARIRESIRTGVEQPRQVSRGWMAIAAGVAAIGFGVTVAYQLGHLRLTHDSQVAFTEQMTRRVSTGMAPGIRDHLHCSHFGRVPKVIPPESKSTEELEPRNRELLAIAKAHAPEGFQMYSAHQCRLKGRKFVHIQFKGGSKLLSVIVAKKELNEAFVRDEAIPALAGVEMYRTNALRFQLAAIESRDYFAYVVSDLGGEQNTQLMVAMAPEVKKYLEKLQG